MPSKLEQIVAQRRLDVAAAKAAVTVEQLAEKREALAAELGGPVDLYKAIRDHQGGSEQMFVAAEFKRASPSKGDIATDLDAGEQAARYAGAGAGLISVLTEPKWFKGSLEDMEAARRAVSTSRAGPAGGRPLVLRKDFVVDEYQLLEARAHGADTVLLMLSILTEAECGHLLRESRKLGMEPLVEVVSEAETQAALRAGAKVLGVNNRNLHTFTVDMQTTPRIVDVVRAAGCIDNVAILALSGIKTRADVAAYESSGGIAGLLVGETLMRAADPAKMIADLVSREAGLTPGAKVVRVKVCGINDPKAALVAAEAGADMIGVIFVQKSVRHATIEQAKAIVEAVRGFRERDGVVDVPLPASDGQGWFPAWAQAIGRACDGQGRPLVVGVFMNHPIDEVNRIAAETGIDLIQLHGSETKADEAACCRPVVRVVHVDAGASASEAGLPISADATLDGPASLLLLDTSIKGGASGGTGTTFDWAIARRVAEEQGIPVVMAGGLTPDNVAAAVAAARPWGVDVASGVEAAPGVKDLDKIRAFIRAAKSA